MLASGAESGVHYYPDFYISLIRNITKSEMLYKGYR
jgi:hypothetical protein